MGAPQENAPPRPWRLLGRGRGAATPVLGLTGPRRPRRYPHDVVNHLSCDEARNHYGGVVSLIPLVLDLMKEWIAHSEKLPRKVQQHVSEPWTRQGTAEATTAQPSQTRGARPWPRKCQCRRLPKDSLRARGRDKGSKPPWRPPGGKL